MKEKSRPSAAVECLYCEWSLHTYRLFIILFGFVFVARRVSRLAYTVKFFHLFEEPRNTSSLFFSVVFCLHFGVFSSSCFPYKAFTYLTINKSTCVSCLKPNMYHAILSNLSMNSICGPTKFYACNAIKRHLKFSSS